jgi:uncharacterized membrane protein
MLKSRKRDARSGYLPLIQRIWSYVWRYLITGLMVWIPLIVTLWVAWLVTSKLIIGVDNLVAEAVLYLRDVGEKVRGLAFLQRIPVFKGFGLLVAVVLFVSTGFFTRYLIGRKIIAYGETIVNRIPLIRRIYRAAQQIRDVFVGRKGTVFQYVCLVEYPRPGMVAVAFVTSAEQGIIQEVTGQELVAVFVPTTPNPTSGYLIYLPPQEIVFLDISIEEAMKLIISGGAYQPVKLLDQARDLPVGTKAQVKRPTAV